MSAAAERLIRAAESTSLSDPVRAVAATLAAAEATLALVEEQRTANLIAFADSCERGGVDNGGAFRRAAERLGLTEVTP